MCKQLFEHVKSTWACKQHVKDTSVQAIILAGEKHIDMQAVIYYRSYLFQVVRRCNNCQRLGKIGISFSFRHANT